MTGHRALEKKQITQGNNRKVQNPSESLPQKTLRKCGAFFVFVGGEKGAHCKKDAPLEMLFGIDVLFFAVANFIEEVCHL